MQVVRYSPHSLALPPSARLLSLHMPALEKVWSSAQASEDDVKRIAILRVFRQGWLSRFKLLQVDDVSPFETHLLFDDGSIVEVDVSKALLLGTVSDPLYADAKAEVDVHEGGATLVTPSLIVVRYVLPL